MIIAQHRNIVAPGHTEVIVYTWHVLNYGSDTNGTTILLWIAVVKIGLSLHCRIML